MTRRAIDALLLSLQTSLTALAIIVVVGTPAAWLLATRVPRARGRDHADRAAARAAAGGGGDRAAGRRRAAGAVGARGVSFTLVHGGGRRRVDLRRRAVLPAPGAGGVRGASTRRGSAASRTLGAGEARTLARVAIPAALPGSERRARARLGPSAGRVRRDADVRRLLPRRHADGAAGHLRALRDRLHGRARALGGARVRLGGAAAGGQARRSVLRVEARAARGGARRRAGDRATAMPRAGRARPARARRRSCRWSRGCSRPSTASSRAATRPGSTPRVGSTCAPERRRCGYVFQDYALFGHLSAWRNVAYGIDGGDRRANALRRCWSASG